MVNAKITSDQSSFDTLHDRRKPIEATATLQHSVISIDETKSVSKQHSHEFPSLRLLITTFVVLFAGSFNFGYQIAIVNPLSQLLQDFIHNSLKRL